MEERIINVDKVLKPLVKSLYYAKAGQLERPVKRILLPDLQVRLIFSFGASVDYTDYQQKSLKSSLGKVLIIGPLNNTLNYDIKSGSEYLVVNFSFDGFYRFFQIPLKEVRGQFIDPDDILGENCFAKLWELMADRSTVGEKMEVMIHFCQNYIRLSDQEALPILNIFPLIETDTSLNPVKVIAQETNLSERTIQNRFQKYMGYSPKEFLRLVRFRKVVDEMMHKKIEGKEDWFDIMENHGYYDQSHLIHDFNFYISSTPLRFSKALKSAQEYCASRFEVGENEYTSS